MRLGFFSPMSHRDPPGDPGHSHSHAQGPGRALNRSMAIALGFAFVEALVGVLSRSLAMRWVAVLALACFTLVAASPASALDPKRAIAQYVQNTWRVEEGLPHNSVRAIWQTRDGYLWLGTYAGLARFDGVRFKVFDTRNSVLTNNEIRTIHEDENGVLWVGTTAGGLYRMEKGVLRKDNRPIQSQTINVILSNRDGALLVGTGNGLYRLSGEGIKRFGVEDGLLANRVGALALAPDGSVFVGSEGGVNILKEGVLSKGPEPRHRQKDVRALLFDREGALYVGGAGLDRFDRSLVPTLSLTVPVEGVHALFQDRDGVIWAGLYGAGIARLDNDKLNMFGQEAGFLDRRAWSITSDRDGGLWIGTRGGIAQLRDGAAISFSTAEGFAGDIGRSVFEDADGALYFGFGGGLSRLANGQVRNIDLGPRLRGAVVRGLMRDHRGRLWVGTDLGLAEEIGPDRYRIYGPEEGLPSGGRFTFEDRSGRLWISSGMGLSAMENGKISIPEIVRPLAGSAIESLFEDRAGSLWIGTLDHGAWRLTGDRLEQVPLLGLTSIGVRSFLEDESGALLIGTIGSGLFVRRGDREVRQITTRDGLVDDSIWSILDDRQGQFWMLSDRGVFRVPKRELLNFGDTGSSQVRPTAVVSTTHGLKSRECNGGASPAGFITKDGRILAPTGAGVAIIDPRLLLSTAPPPAAQIEEVVTDREVIPSDGEVRVPPGSRDTEIHYTGLSFVNPSQTIFRYRLYGHDPDWVEAGTRRVAYYGRLPPGRYVFRAAASNDGVSWTPREGSIEIVVAPLWFQTWLFRIVAFAATAGLIGLAFAWRVRSLKVRERELAATVAARTEELAERSRQLEAANISLGKLATTDDLTGIANHRQFREFLDREWARCARTREPISLLMCDIDEFKAYNDALGHQKGDECLRGVAEVFRETVRRVPDLAARYGGEEFAVVLPATGPEGAIAVAEVIRGGLRDRAIPHPRSSVGPNVTMSIGVCTIVPSADSSTEDLIAVADNALYRAKSKGRDRCVS